MRLLASLFVVAACGSDVTPNPPGPDASIDPDVCETTYLSYDNFGSEFSANWCRGCHSSAIAEGGRQHAPLGVDFDTEADLLSWRDRILVRATGDAPTMPPAGGPSAEERALLLEWAGCGMP